jgi:hypothetical protein
MTCLTSSSLTLTNGSTSRLRPTPGHFALDLALQRSLVRAQPADHLAELGRRLLELACSTGKGLLELGLLDRDLVGRGLLDLQRFVDQVRQNLRAQPLFLFLGDAAVAGGENEGQALIHVGIGDDRAVDDGGRLADRRIARRKQVDIVRQVEPVGRRLVGLIRLSDCHVRYRRQNHGGENTARTPHHPSRHARSVTCR